MSNVRVALIVTGVTDVALVIGATLMFLNGIPVAGAFMLAGLLVTGYTVKDKK